MPLTSVIDPESLLILLKTRTTFEPYIGLLWNDKLALTSQNDIKVKGQEKQINT